MFEHPDLRYVTDAKGNVEAVQLSYKFWEQIEPKVRSHIKCQPADEPLVQAEAPLKGFDQLLQFWDFKYPYTPDVACPHCGAKTDDWRTDAAQPFLLTNANIGGLMVFLCKCCRTTVRKKHFHRHVAVEHTTPKAD